jgi:hypothetical protein
MHKIHIYSFFLTLTTFLMQKTAIVSVKNTHFTALRISCILKNRVVITPIILPELHSAPKRRGRCYDHNCQRFSPILCKRKIGVFLKNNVTIHFLQNSAVCIAIAIFADFLRNYFKNHNIGPSRWQRKTQEFTRNTCKRFFTIFFAGSEIRHRIRLGSPARLSWTTLTTTFRSAPTRAGETLPTLLTWSQFYDSPFRPKNNSHKFLSSIKGQSVWL